MDPLAPRPSDESHPSWHAIALPPDLPPTGRSRRGRRAHRERRWVQQHLGWLRAQVSETNAEFIVVHAGVEPADARIGNALLALDRSVDRGAAATNVGVREKADICIADTGGSALLSQTWRVLTRSGLHTITVRAHADPLDSSAPESPDSSIDAFFVVRRTAILAEASPPPKSAARRPTWWAAMVCVSVYALFQVSRIFSRDVPLSTDEQRWLGTVRELAEGGASPSGLARISVWPSIALPLFETGGVLGVRLTSLFLAVVAIGCAANASSRLFGRWAARLTATMLALAFVVTDVATRATPVSFAVAALAAAFLGIALAEANDRPSWLLMSAAGAVAAVATDHRSIAFVVALLPAIAIVRGRDWWTYSRNYAIAALLGIAAWALPRRSDVADAVEVWRSQVSVSDITTATLLAVGVAAVAAAFIALAFPTQVARRRLWAVGVSALAFPTASAMSFDDNGHAAALTMLAVLVVPAIGGLIAHVCATAIKGPNSLPPRRRGPDLLTIDPSTGHLDGNQVRYSNRQMQLAGGLLAVTAVWFFPWAILNANWGNWWLAIPFLASNCAVGAAALLSAFNGSRRSIPLQLDVAVGHEPLVGVIVPTAGEPIEMVHATVRSILDQDWPLDRLRIVVSDDGHGDAVRDHFERLSDELPDGVLTYCRPPARGTPDRIGDSKAGNMNYAIFFLNEARCEFVETRDADDLVGSTKFLRATVSHMMADPEIGFVQTIKESHTSLGDPFNNNEPFFYRGMMLARNSDSAAFPCGSGLVWRRAALRDIGNFPVWNLVEDLHSGVLALRSNWPGLYVPIVGTYAQHAPEDVANYFKQRGTWALDTVRLFAFDRLRGLPWRTRLHFVEQAGFYMLSLPIMALLIIPMIGLAIGEYPIETDPTSYALHFAGFALSIEIIMLALSTDQRSGVLWRTRTMLIGMAPLYFTSVVRALWYGASRKPIYVVTRKIDRHQVYFRMVRIHWLLLAMTLTAIVLSAVRGSFLLGLDPGAMYWAFVGLFGLGSFLRLSWFGVDVRARLMSRMRLRRR